MFVCVCVCVCMYVCVRARFEYKMDIVLKCACQVELVARIRRVSPDGHHLVRERHKLGERRRKLGAVGSARLGALGHGSGALTARRKRRAQVEKLGGGKLRISKNFRPLGRGPATHLAVLDVDAGGDRVDSRDECGQQRAEVCDALAARGSEQRVLCFDIARRAAHVVCRLARVPRNPTSHRPRLRAARWAQRTRPALRRASRWRRCVACASCELWWNR